MPLLKGSEEIHKRLCQKELCLVIVQLSKCINRVPFLLGQPAAKLFVTQHC